MRRVSDDVHWHDVVGETPGECKVCRRQISDGTSDRPGRWWIRESSHDVLLEAAGWYRRCQRTIRMTFFSSNLGRTIRSLHLLTDQHLLV